MWIATEKGFFSIVVNHDSRRKEDEIIIRARKITDLENLFSKKRIKVNKNKDYAYRVFSSRKELTNILINLSNNLNYTNFKDHISILPDQKDKKSAYNQIWSVMNDYQGRFIKGLYNFVNERNFY